MSNEQKASKEQVAKLKQLLKVTFESNLEPALRELFAHEIVIDLLRASFPDLNLDGYLASARHSPALEEFVRHRYREPLEKLLLLIDEAQTLEEVVQTLEQMPPNWQN